jgi:hypothetical protein
MADCRRGLSSLRRGASFSALPRPPSVNGPAHRERGRRTIRVKRRGCARPHVWTSGSRPMASPAAIPFTSLIRGSCRAKPMLEVEGGTLRSCLRLMRHGQGTVDNAYRLRRRRSGNAFPTATLSPHMRRGLQPRYVRLGAQPFLTPTRFPGNIRGMAGSWISGGALRGLAGAEKLLCIDG